MEVRELLAAQEFDEDAPVVRVSALKALEGDEKWVESIVELMAAVDESIPDPVRETEKPFLMPVEDVFTITGRGTVITGRIERGVVKVNETVDLIGIRPEKQTTTVTGVETLPEGTEMVMPGDNTDMSVELIQPIAMEEGLRFAIREGGRTVGAGRVTKITK